MNKHLVTALLAAALAGPVSAQFSALMVFEPTERKDGLMVSRTGLEAGLAKALGQEVTAAASDNLTDAMRATRSKDYDLFIAPPQVVASALAHGYELVGNTDPDEQYVLVGRASLASAEAMRQGRIYLPQQDSIYTYLARGMLTANGLSFKDLGHVQYARYPQAGLTALSLNLAEATVIRRSEWEAWSKGNPGVAKQLAVSGAVPGGLSVAVKKDLSAELRARVAKWFGSSASSIGMKPVAQRSDASAYRRVAELGTFTPVSLPGATVVDVAEVQRLLAQGAVLVDTRTEKEFKQSRINGARHVPYHEKSLKDVAYDPKLDDFAGLAALDKKLPTIFHCNGAECWKSYKASRAALAAGFSKVYWFRGGMPAWAAATTTRVALAD
ncbi:Sulfurtransferase [Rubrivivax sp. A210]|uniref:rhodanese-like domain-containing protein n=1 Tax=Rubrivivax sp. A210 TaxID=2772301 RepID=UPI00191A5B29|nr:rhodanese-like domain-containing protein [Rubrivivax sp. A210]CAD5374193.1 Sulfurtransferase [Rubrivivax sp. A210]